jgi:hypothetical protein
VSERVTVPRIVPWAARLDPPSATATAALREVRNHGLLENLLSMRISLLERLGLTIA